MAANAELARIFQEMSAILELTGANAFRVNAYARASRVLNDMTTDVADTADHKQLVAIEGIGDGTAKKILSFLDTGMVKEHRTLLPPNLAVLSCSFSDAFKDNLGSRLWICQDFLKILFKG